MGLKKHYWPPIDADERGKHQRLFSIWVYPRLSAAKPVLDFFRNLLLGLTKKRSFLA